MKKHCINQRLFRFLALATITLVIVSCHKQPKDLKSALKKYSDQPIELINADSLYKESYKMYFTQVVDHENKNSEAFSQKVYISHVGYDRPTVVILEGYTAGRNYLSELSKLLNANQVIIEHRFYGDSKPDSIPWDYLTVKQAATDQHLIIQALKNIYKGKWVSTGISKGGQTTIFHRRFYPNDVDVSIPYVAPLNLAREDPRIQEHLNTVGTKICRDKVTEFQKLLFESKNKLLPLVKENATKSDLNFLPIGIERAYDLNVLEYSFAFWQWSGDCDLIPGESASIETIFNHWKSISPFSFFAQDETDLAFTYQALYEIGFYNYDITLFKEYISDTVPATFDFKLPEHMRRDFNTEVMKDINNWVQEEGNYFLYISGEYDPWGATVVNPSSHTIAVKMVNPDGNHRTRIKSFPKDMKENIYKLLESWLDVEIQRKKCYGGTRKEGVLEIL